MWNIDHDCKCLYLHVNEQAIGNFPACFSWNTKEDEKENKNNRKNHGNKGRHVGSYVYKRKTINYGKKELNWIANVV